MAERIQAELNRPLWGGRTLHVGELVVIIVVFGILFWKFRGLLRNMWLWLILAMVIIAMILW